MSLRGMRVKKAVKSWLCATLVAALPLSVWSQSPPGNKWVSGYWASYLLNKPDYQDPRYVDMTAMTHFIFGRIGAGGGQNGGSPGQIMLGGDLAQTATWTGPGAPTMTTEDWMIKRAHEAGTKALIMLGGEGDNSAFRASTTAAVRPVFIANLVDYMVAHDYDGIDVNWEGYMSAEDEAALEALLTELRAAANARPRYQSRPVIITYPAGMLNPNYQSVTPHILRVASLVDQYNLMSYGVGWFGGDWHSTVFSALTGQTPNRPVSVAGTVQMLVDAGIPRAKIGMGIGFYGMNYKPPFTQPDQPTKDYDMSLWSVNDVYWNYAMLNKHGYLSNGSYVWEPSTQMGYRTYGAAGYTPASRPDQPSGYLSYEDPESIAAKGAWAKSGAPGAGVGGTIIWAVNYGTTNGANNPLLTAVKKAFIDPNATDPHPEPPPPYEPPPGTITTTITVENDWGSGYCGTLRVANSGQLPWEWNVTVPLQDTVTSLWNGTYVAGAGQITVKGLEWNKLVYPGEPRAVGLCATRPVTTPPPGDPAPGAITATVAITADWTSGYCGSISVSNTGSTTVSPWQASVTVQGRLNSMWNGSYVQDGATVTVSPPSWNPGLAAGKTNSDIGFCATR